MATHNTQRASGVPPAPLSSLLAQAEELNLEERLGSPLGWIRPSVVCSPFLVAQHGHDHPTSHHEGDQDGKSCGVDPFFPIVIGGSIHAPVGAAATA